jgi:hypothetical protein
VTEVKNIRSVGHGNPMQQELFVGAVSGEIVFITYAKKKNPLPNLGKYDA